MKDKAAVDSLIYLVSCAVNEEKPSPERCAEMDTEQVFKAAQRHSLTVMAAYALEKAAPVPQDFREEKFKAVRRLSLYDVERAKIFAVFESRGIWYLPLKGIVLKDCYPKTYFREMSDNDILCDREKMDSVRDFMLELGYTCGSFGKDNHDIYVKKPVLEFEMHRTLFYEPYNPELYAYYDNVKDRLVKEADSSFGFRMTDEDMYIFLICHLYKHYRLSGTGLRSLLDIFLFRRKHGDMDRAYLETEFNKLGLAGFEGSVSVLADKLFTGQSLSENEETELEYIAESDTHGTKENNIARRLENDDSGRAKRAYALKRIFPDSETLRKHHPVIYRHRILYPFWMAVRPVRGVLFKRKRLMREFNTLKDFEKKDNRGKFNRD